VKAPSSPLVRFVVLGSLLFGADYAIRVARGPRADEEHRIVITSDFARGLAERNEEKTGHTPDAEELEGLIDEYIRDEALSREARSASLDRGDPIVRRRLIQKIEFVLTGASVDATPTSDELQEFLVSHEAEFAAPPRIEITQLYFAGESAQTRAESSLAALREGREADRGDPHARGTHLGPMPESALDSALGEDFSARLRDFPEGQWEGPIESTGGVHLVRIERRLPRELPALESVRARVEAAWRTEHRLEAVEREVMHILERYEVVREDRAS
jgi:peptidyl-prolyl cis-trans isomerase C